MQYILALSVIILHHVDSYSCRAVAKELKQPIDPNTDTSESFELKEREREITGILKQLLERSSSEINSSEQLQQSLAKLTIEPYKGKNITKMKDPLNWFDKRKKTIAPLAIIVTNLSELNKLQNRDKNNENKYLIENIEEETPDSNPQDIIENPKEITDKNLNTDLHANKKSYNSTIDAESDNDDNPEEGDNLDVNSHDLEEFSDEDFASLSKDLNKHGSSPYIDIAWHSKEEIVTKDAKYISKEMTKLQESLEISNDNIYFITESINKIKDEVEENKKNTFKKIPLTEESVSFGINERADTSNGEDQENLINLLLEDKDGTDFKINTDNEEPATLVNNENTTSLNDDSKITLKVTNVEDEDKFVVSTKEPHHVEGGTTHHHGKCKKDCRYNARNTYNLSFLFNR